MIGRFFTVLMVALALFGGLAEAQSPQPGGRSPLGVGPPPAERSAASPARPTVAPEAVGYIDRAWYWMMAKQAEIHRALSQAVLRLKTEGLLVSTAILAGLSFAYGILHAAGPGHGKAIISSYVLANEQTVRRGIMLSFLAALFQALSAIIIVGVLAIALKMTGLQMRRFESWLETLSWGLVALVGGWLLFGQLRRLSAFGSVAAHAGRGHGASHDHAHDHGLHGAHGHHHDTHQRHGHHHHGHVHDHDGACCDHAHMPDPKALEGELSWRKAIAIAFAVGIRPCTGAIVVLVFALSQGLLWAGIFATFAMALGTAITVSALAALAVGSRELAARLGNGGGRWPRAVQTVAGIGGSAAVMLMGVAFFLASLNGSGPL